MQYRKMIKTDFGQSSIIEFLNWKLSQVRPE